MADCIAVEKNKQLLMKTANDVETLVVNQAHRERFKLAGDRFYKEWTKWATDDSARQQQIRNYIKKSQASKDERLRTKTVEPPMPGYVFDEGCWIPYVEKPICPASKLIGDIRPNDDKEELENSYTLLTIIHDKLGEEFIQICCEPPMGLAALVGCINFNLTDVQKRLIKNALRRVKADFASGSKAGKINKTILFRWYLEGVALCILLPIYI
jgi:hypothetical protein